MEKNGKVIAGHIINHGQHNNALFIGTLSCPKLYLSGKHGKAVAVFTIVQQEPESRNIIEFFEQLKIICSDFCSVLYFQCRNKS